MPEYQLLRKLGSGAFGEVWLANDQALGVQLAVKFVHPSRIHDASNFYAEPHTLKQLAHPNVVRVEDAGKTPDGRLYVAMEYLSRGSIADEAKGATLPLSRAMRLISDACRGAEFAHNLGVVHRDIKPANILLSDTGAAKLSDFGLATRVTSSKLTASPYGYVAHLAPEVFLHNSTSPLSDVYALGVTLYRLVNGDAFLPSLPIDELIALVIDGKFPDRTRHRLFVPSSLRRVITKALAVEPSERYQSAAALRHALEQTRILCDWEEGGGKDTTTWMGTSTSSNDRFEAAVTKVHHGSWSVNVR